MKSDSLTELNVDNLNIREIKDIFSRSFVNGGAIVKCFSINNDKFLDYPVMKDEIETYFNTLLTSKDIRSAIPELKINEQLDSKSGFKWISSFVLDGQIASVIYNGGAYVNFVRTPKESKEIAMRFCSTIFQDRYNEVQVYVSYKPWSPWFYDIAWDYSWIILDLNLKKIWLICLTDTD